MTGDTKIAIEAKCKEKGLRMTEQRRLIAQTLSEARDHPDAEELHRRVNAKSTENENISLATVYRTLKLFYDADIIGRLDLKGERARYEEAQKDHHDHLINIRTGEIIEFLDEEIERLQIEVARRLGYELMDHRLELYGVPLETKD